MWRLITTRLHVRRVDTRKIRRLMKISEQPNALRMNHAEVAAAQGKTIQRYKEHKKIQNKLRTQLKSQVNKCQAKKYKTTEEAQCKITKNAFRSKHTFQRINLVLEKKI
jgi:hypothetical protein